MCDRQGACGPRLARSRRMLPSTTAHRGLPARQLLPLAAAPAAWLQDGQLETFMAVARRQIKYLEDEVKRVKDLG